VPGRQEPMGEFDLIDRYFATRRTGRKEAHRQLFLGIGDDAALLRCPKGKRLGGGSRHPGGRPALSGGSEPRFHRSSVPCRQLEGDLAAMGATPAVGDVGLDPAIRRCPLARGVLRRLHGARRGAWRGTGRRRYDGGTIDRQRADPRPGRSRQRASPRRWAAGRHPGSDRYSRRCRRRLGAGDRPC